jgi:hypothetical protein
MKTLFMRFFHISAFALAVAVSFISCPEEPENGPVYLSGSVTVSLNGEVKRFSKLTIYSDEGLTKPIGTPLVEDRQGKQGLNDSGWVTLGPYLGDGNWRASIKEKIDTPIEKIWIKVESSAWGSSSKVIPYSLYLYDKSITGIYLGHVGLQGTKLTLKIGNNITLNGSPDVKLYIMYVYRVLPGGNQFILSPNVAYMSTDDNTYTWDTGVIDDNDDILIYIYGSRINTNTLENGRYDTTIKGSALKAGYTLENIALDPYH